jgi:hypothetical protein
LAQLSVESLAVGAITQASAQQDAAKYQAAVARNNQITASQNAQYAAQAGAVEAQARDRRNASIAGSILAGQGASGIDINSTNIQGGSGLTGAAGSVGHSDYNGAGAFTE